MKTYHFDITIYEGNNEFWEEIQDRSGCDDVKELLENMLSHFGFDESNSKVLLRKFEEKEEIPVCD